MKCRRLKALTFQIRNKGRLSGITDKTALTRLYFIYCVSQYFIMGYLVEKQGLVGFAYHPMNQVDEWESKADEMDKETAKKKALELSEKERGRYRVRSIWDGKISFEIAT